MYKNNYIVYFLGYLFQSFTIYTLFSYLSWYITIETATNQLLYFLRLIAALISLIMFISKPFIAIISDLVKLKIFMGRKFFLFIGYLGFLPNFVLTVIFYKNIALSVIFSLLYLIFLSFIDVAIDGNIIDSSSTSRSINLKIIISLSGYSGGILLYQLIPFIIRLFPRNLEINYLMLFQVILFILIAVFSLLLFDGRIAKDFNLKNRNLSEKKPLFFSSARYVKLFSIMALGLFLYSLRDIFNDTSYIINYAHFFLNVLQFHNISILLPIFSIFGYLGALIAVTIIKKPKRLLYILIPILVFANVLLIANLRIGIFRDHMILTQLISMLGGFILVILTSLMMDFSKDKMSFKFQILNIVGPVSYILLVPYGNIWFSSLELYLFSSIIIGIFVVLSLIPIKFVELEHDTIDY